MRVATAVLALGVTGCSLVFVHGPPDHPLPLTPPPCTDSYLVPGLDASYAVLSGVSAILAAHMGCQGMPCGQVTYDALSGLLALAIFAPVAAHGFSTVSRCKAVRQAQIAAAEAAYEVQAAAAQREREHGERLPERLDRDTVARGMRAVTNLVLACSHDFPAATGAVRVHFDVAGDGRIAARVTQAPDPGLGACVAQAVGQLRFPPTQHGGAFSYPFVFGGAAAGSGSDMP